MTGEEVEQNNFIEAENLGKVYRSFLGFREVKALEGLSFNLSKGEVVGLLGPNGAGKTTTLMLILGLLTPTSGRIQLFGKNPKEVAVKEKVGFLPEESYFYRFFTGEEILHYYGRLFPITSDLRKIRVDSLLKRVGLWEARKRRLKGYSKGMLRRIGLAQALINNPEMLILDEPTAGLDPIGTREVKEMILQLKTEGKTILLCSHLLGDMQEVCDRILMLYRGRVLREGPIREVLAKRNHIGIDFRNLPPEGLEEIRKVAEKYGSEVVDVEPSTETLEDFFIKTIEASR